MKHPDIQIHVQHEQLPPGLYVVATPIGNIQDISLRALTILLSVDAIYCEDTRVTNKLLQHYGIKGSMHVYNDTSKKKDRVMIVERAQTEAIALVSDAGTPLISDPGYKLIADAVERDITVTACPGACAAINALVLSAMPSDNFVFHGFLPNKEAALKKKLLPYAASEATHIAYERGSRVLEFLEHLAKIWPECDVVIAREMTKKFEEVKRDTITSLIKYYAAEGTPKGEVVILFRSNASKTTQEDDLVELIQEHLKEMKVKDAVKAVSELTGIPKNTVYDLAIKVKHGNENA